MSKTKEYLVTAATIVACGCAPHRTVDVQPVTYHGWKDCWRLSDGEIEVIVVPQVGRIMRFGFAGGRNVLWEHPALPQAVPADDHEWRNYGGDKIWPWPQGQWGQVAGRSWPPPVDVEVLSHIARPVNANTIRLTSPPLRGYDVRVVRDICLSAEDSAVTITSRFEPCDSRAADLPWPEVWAVSQIRPPDRVCVRVAGDPSAGRLYRDMVSGPWLLEQAGSPAVRWLTRPRNSAKAKVGVRADAIAAVFGRDVFVQQFVPSGPSAVAEPTDRAQIYAEPDGPDPMAYWELEFLGGAHHRAPAPLTVRWRLHRLPAGASLEQAESIMMDLPAD